MSRACTHIRHALFPSPSSSLSLSLSLFLLRLVATAVAAARSSVPHPAAWRAKVAPTTCVSPHQVAPQLPSHLLNVTRHHGRLTTPNRAATRVSPRQAARQIIVSSPQVGHHFCSRGIKSVPSVCVTSPESRRRFPLAAPNRATIVIPSPPVASPLFFSRVAPKPRPPLRLACRIITSRSLSLARSHCHFPFHCTKSRRHFRRLPPSRATN